MNAKRISSLIAGLVCATALHAFAADDMPPKHEGGKPHTPPPEAIAACKGLAEKDVCKFTNHKNETVEGVCAAPHKEAESTALACRPHHHKDKPEAK